MSTRFDRITVDALAGRLCKRYGPIVSDAVGQTHVAEGNLWNVAACCSENDEP